MANVNGPKYTGTLLIDLSDVKDDLCDLAPTAMRGLRVTQPGIEDVIKELATAMPAHGEGADIPPQVYKRFTQRTELLEKLDAHEARLEKALEVCKETRAKTENDREDDITMIAKAAQNAAKKAKDPGLAAPFEKTIAYNGQIAEKGLQTRKKNEEEAKAKTEEAKAKAGGPASVQGT